MTGTRLPTLLAVPGYHSDPDGTNPASRRVQELGRLLWDVMSCGMRCSRQNWLLWGPGREVVPGREDMSLEAGHTGTVSGAVSSMRKQLSSSCRAPHVHVTQRSQLLSEQGRSLPHWPPSRGAEPHLRLPPQPGATVPGLGGCICCV